MRHTTWKFPFKRNHLVSASVVAVLLSVAGVSGLAQGHSGDRLFKRQQHFRGLINDHTASAAVIGGGPYEMHGVWSLDVDARRGTASFSAAMDMETSDYGIVQGTVNKDDPTTRGAHTHHISMTDAVVTYDWEASCPKFNPTVTDGFVVSGVAFVTGNGSGAPFGNPSPLTVCVLGGTAVGFSNMTMTFGMPASRHFGTAPTHGVVSKCTGPSGHASPDCTVQQ